MNDASRADPFSTFLNVNSGRRTFGSSAPSPGPDADPDAGGLPGEGWAVLEALNRQRAMEVGELKSATSVPTVQLVRLLALLEERGFARILEDGEDDVAMITSAGRAALAGHAAD